MVGHTSGMWPVSLQESQLSVGVSYALPFEVAKNQAAESAQV